MAEEDTTQEGGEEGGAGGGGAAEAKKCPECPPAGLPGWMATFSDMVTLLLTFFVLLLSFAKTETAKYEAALGSIRNAFGGNVLKYGEVIQNGKSASDQPTMMDSENPVMPFPIEFLTMEGLLDKHEINRYSDEEIKLMTRHLKKYELTNSVEVEEMPEGIKVRIADKILFKKDSSEIEKVNVQVFERLINLLKNEDWTVFVEGHSSTNEGLIGGLDPYELSALRTRAVTTVLKKKGIDPERITSVFYGDSRPLKEVSGDNPSNRRVEFLIRKRDLRSRGHKVDVR